MTGRRAEHYDGEPVPIRRALDRLVRHLGRVDLDTWAVVQERWPEVVGSATAASARPLNLTNGRLDIEVDDSLTAHHLGVQRLDLQRSINRMCGETVVTSVRFITRPAGR